MPDTRTQAQGPPEDWKLVLDKLVKHTTKPHVPHPEEEKVESFNGSKNDRERAVGYLRKFEFTCQLNGYNDDKTKIEKLGAALSGNASVGSKAATSPPVPSLAQIGWRSRKRS